MKVTHIFHSGFMLEMEESILLFDWYKGDLPSIADGKRLYVFCSHEHGDHYSPAIWDLQKKVPEVTYILDEGISDAARHPEAEVIMVRPHEAYAVHALRIRTLTSTDMGVAFYIETEGKRIYHAGDLNVWYWNDEPMEDNIASEAKCRAEMQSLADILRAGTGEDGDAEKDGTGHAEEGTEGNCGGGKAALLDVAFVPLDPRLEEHAPLCMAAFVEILDAKCIFPMHYWAREDETRAYLKDARIRGCADRICFDREKTI